MRRPHLLMLMPAVLWAAIAPAQGGAAGPPPSNLAFKFRPGEVTRYRYAIRLEMRSAALPGGGTVVTEEYMETSQVLSVRPDGGAEVRTVMSSFAQKIDGQATPAARSMLTGIPRDVPIVHQVARNGQILGSAIKQELPLADKIKTEAALRSMKGHAFQLPDKTPGMGGSWRREETLSNAIPGGGTMDTLLTTDYTLAAREAVLGLPCVKILASGTGTGTLEKGRGRDELRIKGTLWFSPDRGEVVKMVMENADVLQVTGPNGAVRMDTTAVVSFEMVP